MIASVMVLLVGMAMARFISRGVSMSMLARPIERGRPAVITVTMTRGMAWIMSRSVVWHGGIWWRVGDMNGVEVTRTRSGRHQSAWSRVVVVVVPRIAVIKCGANFKCRFVNPSCKDMLLFSLA